ncbi:MAG: SAM-dependent methyltransferase [Rhizobiales bacterium]|nr:SAM-dependent methyltransferase [Hyphomicrobiales bacterium]
MASELPAELKAAIERRIEGMSRSDAARRSRSISDTYRSGGNSLSIKSDEDALAYALVRMPATYAAIGACLGAIAEARPEFAPATLLDVGAGPGTATWAANHSFPSLGEFALIDSNDSLRALALELAKASSSLGAASYVKGDAATLLATSQPADLVVASYVAGELGDTARANLADAMWSKTNDTLLIVEPGTPSGYARIVDLRAHLIAKGAHVVAPCPHDKACPLEDPDWCHFSQRLARSRAHKQIKGADVPFEDEKFSYVALSRAPIPERPSRVLAQPKISKVAVKMKVCTTGGVETKTVPHRDKRNYSILRKLNWGDAIPQKFLPAE